MKKILAILLAAFVVISCFAACGNEKPDTGDSNTPFTEDGKLRPPSEDVSDLTKNSFAKFRAVDFEGNIYDESLFKGKKLTMINIWATFCRPCINEMPDLEKLSKAYAEEDFQLIGMVCDVTYNEGYYDTALLERAVEVAGEVTGTTYLHLLPSPSLDYIKLEEVYSVPETIFVDENGNVINRSYIGSRSYEDWKAIVDDILANM